MRDVPDILLRWTDAPVAVEEQYHANAGQVVRVRFGGNRYILKGIPEDKPEETIRGNVAAYRFLGNEMGLSQKIYATLDGAYYVHAAGRWFYLLEYIDGRNLQETAEDEYQLGQMARQMHDSKDYPTPSALREDQARFYAWFPERAFKQAFDRIVAGLPDFGQLDRCLIHTDLGPHNAVRRTDGRVFLIDLDDAGLGSRHLDVGWPFIMQFVDFNHQTGAMRYRFDLAKAFVQGYYGAAGLTPQEYDRLWDGAVYMHMSYMQTYGPDAVESLWAILQFGLAQKEALWRMLQNGLTACGECCDGCQKKQTGACPGCIEADGYVPEWAESGRCRVHACTREHGVTFCGACPVFPCKDIGRMMPWKPDAVEQMKALCKRKA